MSLLFFPNFEFCRAGGEHIWYDQVAVPTEWHFCSADLRLVSDTAVSGTAKSSTGFKETVRWHYALSEVCYNPREDHRVCLCPAASTKTSLCNRVRKKNSKTQSLTQLTVQRPSAGPSPCCTSLPPHSSPLPQALSDSSLPSLRTKTMNSLTSPLTDGRMDRWTNAPFSRAHGQQDQI